MYTPRLAIICFAPLLVGVSPSTPYNVSCYSKHELLVETFRMPSNVGLGCVKLAP